LGIGSTRRFRAVGFLAGFLAFDAFDAFRFAIRASSRERPVYLTPGFARPWPDGAHALDPRTEAR